MVKTIIYKILLKIFLLKKRYELRKINYNEIPNLSFKNNLNHKALHSENYIKKIFPDFIIDKNELEEIKNINEKLIEEKKYFDNFWYQCGGLEEEIYIICFLLIYLKPQNILEIGIANGFSSAFTVHYAKKKNIEIHQIDLPRISTKRPLGWYNKILKILSQNAMIKDNENIFDLRTGGTIPFEKYQGWMINKNDFFYKKRFMYVGDASKIISIMNKKFDFILVDAMKNPNERLSLLSAILKNSKSNFCIIQDGGWVNDAFKNFCKINKLELFNYGKIQFTFKK